MLIYIYKHQRIKNFSPCFPFYHILLLYPVGEEELDDDDDERIKIVDYEGLKNGKLIIEDADFPDRDHYTCEAYNQIESLNTTIFVRVKGMYIFDVAVKEIYS